MWKELLTEYPDSIHVQHIKENIPAADVKRIAGVKTMVEIWRRLEKVCGNTDLNKIRVKTKFENLVPKSNVDHQRIFEVFKAVKTAVKQLETLDALQYLKDDFGVVSKVVLRLPAAE